MKNRMRCLGTPKFFRSMKNPWGTMILTVEIKVARHKNSLKGNTLKCVCARLKDE